MLNIFYLVFVLASSVLCSAIPAGPALSGRSSAMTHPTQVNAYHLRRRVQHLPMPADEVKQQQILIQKMVKRMMEKNTPVGMGVREIPSWSSDYDIHTDSDKDILIEYDHSIHPYQWSDS